MRVSWSQFDIFANKCPLWYTWSYHQAHRLKPPGTKPPGSNPNPRTGQLKPWTKDTQHMIRGNATQWIVDLWAFEHWYKESAETQLRYLDGNIGRVIREAMEEGRYDGAPRITEEEIRSEVYPNLVRILPTLTHLYERTNPDPVTRQPPRAQYEVISRGPYETDLLAVTDLVFFNERQEAVVFEGKSTRKPSQAKHDQLRWQMEIFKAGNRPIVNENYYIFYSTGQVWPVSFTDPQHNPWVTWRDEQLLSLVNGNTIPTPGAFQCEICPHARGCIHKHTQ